MRTAPTALAEIARHTFTARHVRMLKQAGALLLAAFTQSACISGIHAIDRFSEQLACPKGDLVLQRTDVFEQDLLVTATPPAEVAADPRRLAVWEKNESPRKHLSGYSQLTAFNVTGCGTQSTYFCWNEDRADESVSECSIVNLQSASTMFEGFRISPSLRQRLDASPKLSGASRYLGV